MTRLAPAIALLAALAWSAAAGAVSLPGRDAFSVSGKGGPFLKQVANRKFGAAAKPAGKGADGALGLSSDAVNRGEFQAARLRMPQTEARIKALLDRTEAGWPYDKSQPIQVYILGLDFYQAYALPDGSLMVAFGLLEQAQSDDEVAFVLSHELGHVRLGHFSKDDTLKKRAEMISRLGQAYAVASALRSGGGAAGAANAAAEAAGRQADALGFDLSQAANFSAESASARVFDTIQADQVNRKSLTDTLDGQLKAQLSKVSPTAAANAMAGGMGGIRGGLLRGAGRVALGVAGSLEGGPKHRSPEARKAGIASYSADAYPQGLPLRDEDRTWLNLTRRSREYAEAQIAVPAVRQAMKLRADGDYAGAQAQLALALKTSYGDSPLVLNEAARLRGDQGDASGSAQLFQQAHRRPDQTIDGYLDHARMLYRTGHPDPALEVISAGESRFEDEKPFLSLIIALDRQAGRLDQVQAVLQRCRSSGDEALKKDCELAAAAK